MIRFLADENFNGKVVRGVRRIRPDADIVRVQDLSIYKAKDPRVLEWAATEGRILLSHDAETMIGYANERIAAELPMPGLIIARQELAVGIVVNDLLTILGASTAEDWENVVLFLPL
jgi:hypothetical protein